MHKLKHDRVKIPIYTWSNKLKEYVATYHNSTLILKFVVFLPLAIILLVSHSCCVLLYKRLVNQTNLS